VARGDGPGSGQECLLEVDGEVAAVNRTSKENGFERERSETEPGERDHGSQCAEASAKPRIPRANARPTAS
jgi:hypothetical protein